MKLDQQRVIDKVKADKSFLIYDWIESQKISSKPIKVTIPGPMTITDTIANNYYSFLL